MARECIHALNCVFHNFSTTHAPTGYLCAQFCVFFPITFWILNGLKVTQNFSIEINILEMFSRKLIFSETFNSLNASIGNEREKLNLFNFLNEWRKKLILECNFFSVGTKRQNEKNCIHRYSSSCHFIHSIFGFSPFHYRFGSLQL